MNNKQAITLILGVLAISYTLYNPPTQRILFAEQVEDLKLIAALFGYIALTTIGFFLFRDKKSDKE